MSIRDKLLVFEGKAHDVRCAILRREIPLDLAIEKLDEIMKPKDMARWEIEKRYKSWVKEPITPELLFKPEDLTFEKVTWSRFDISKIKVDKPAELGSTIYKKLMDSELLEYCPSLEALDFYEKNPGLRYQYWDRMSVWVYAWRDAVLSNRPGHNILVPGMRVYVPTGKVFRRWMPLQSIHETKFKVIYRN